MGRIFAGISIVLVFAVFLIFTLTSTKEEGTAASVPGLKNVKSLISEGKLNEAKEKLDEIVEKNPDLPDLGEVYFDLAKAYEKDNQIVTARDMYKIILKKYQNIPNILDAQEELGKLNISIILSSIVTDQDLSYEIEKGDTLSKIAKKFGTTVDLIKAANSLKDDTIRVGSRLKIPRRNFKILIDKSQNLLTLLSDDDLVKVYSVSTGENNSTPKGTFKIVNRIANPVWYKENAMVPSESPDNILGSRWLGLSIAGYGIHGTVEPDSVGRQATKGCVRMLNKDVEELFIVVPIGTEVTIVD